MAIRESELAAPCFREVNRALLHNEYTHYWLKGGRASCKSSYVSLAIVLGVMEDEQANAIIYRQVGATLADSVVAQCIWAINLLGANTWWRLIKSPYQLIYLPTGQRILFKGNDSAEKSKGIKLADGYFKYVWFEELTEFDGMDEVETVLRSVVRGDNHTNVFYTYNPPKSANNWVNSECLIPRPDRLVHHSTYLDVPPEWLGQQFIAEAEQTKTTKLEKYAWAYMGEVTGTGGAVFDNVVTRPIPDEEMQGYTDKLYDGMDFGFTVDPAAYVLVNYNAAHKRLVFVDEYVKTGASFDTLAAEVKKRNPHRRPVAADSAEPRSIDELRQRGITVYAAKKGPGSVEHGIKWLQDLEGIIIDPARTPEAAREFNGYEYPRDKNDRFKAQYPDADNHTIDAARYALEEVMKPQGGKFVTVRY